MSKEFQNDRKSVSGEEYNANYVAPHLVSKVKSKVQPKVYSRIQSKLMTGLGGKRETHMSVADKLPGEVQAKMETSFGQDFSGVTIHKDSTSAQDINAKAYTQGNHIHFAPGEYNPQSKEGQELIGHELSHVVQQGQGKVGPGEIHSKGLEINQDEVLEKEADQMGKLASEGKMISKEVTSQGGNSAVQRTTKKAGSLPKYIKLTIAADKEADYFDDDYFDNAAVGHSWIMIKMPSGLEDSYGFWPANLGAGGGFDPSKPWKDVDGEVRHPDTAHTPNAKYTVDIDTNQLGEGQKYAVEKASAKYNLLWYNCTTFAREFFEKASGRSAPPAGTLIEDPNALYTSIERLNFYKGLDATGNKKPAKKKINKSYDKTNFNNTNNSVVVV